MGEEATGGITTTQSLQGTKVEKCVGLPEQQETPGDWSWLLGLRAEVSGANEIRWKANGAGM